LQAYSDIIRYNDYCQFGLCYTPPAAQIIS
jgi:hypothetical protein